MIDLLVFNKQLSLLGEVSEYIDLQIERKLDTYSELMLTVGANEEKISLLKDGNVITTQSNPSYGYVIQHVRYAENNNKVIEVVAFSLNYLLTYRAIFPQQTITSNHETAIRRFVSKNAINPDDPKRVIPRLELGDNGNIGFRTTFVKTGGNVLEYVMSVANEVGATVDILIDHRFATMYLSVQKGVNRSANQSTNPVVMFSEEFDNVLNQEYFLSYINYKNAAIVAGEGEGNNRIVVNISQSSGLDRRELYVDARDLQREYQDDNGNEQLIPLDEYTDALISRGQESLLETSFIETFEAEVDDTQFVYGVDYTIGDTVSVRSKTFNFVSHVPVSSVTITANPSGVKIVPTLGTALPNLYRKGVR